MIPKKVTPAVSTCLALVACGDSVDGSPREGQYLQQVKITELVFPGITPETRKQTIAQMERAAGGGTGGMFCMGGRSGQNWKKVTADLSRRLGGKCETVRESGSPTKADIEVRCTGTPKGDVVAKVQGEAAAESYTATMTMDFVVPATKEMARIVMDVSAKRVGKCPN